MPIGEQQPPVIRLAHFAIKVLCSSGQNHPKASCCDHKVYITVPSGMQYLMHTHHMLTMVGGDGYIQLLALLSSPQGERRTIALHTEDIVTMPISMIGNLKESVQVEALVQYCNYLCFSAELLRRFVWCVGSLSLFAETTELHTLPKCQVLQRTCLHVLVLVC